MPNIHYVDFHYYDFGKLNYYKITQEYIDWLNKCFDKNTNRVFEPGRVRQNIKEFPTGGSAYELPSKRFPIDVYIIPFKVLRNEGSSFFEQDGRGVALAAGRLEGKLSLVEKNTVLHEMGHIFGCAIGEFYSIRNIFDLTLVPPDLKVSATAPKDDYWSLPQRKNWKHDPMLNNPENPQFCELNTIVINYGGWRMTGPPTPDLDHIIVQSEFPNTKVDIYSFTKNKQFFLSTTATDSNGQLLMGWHNDHYNALSNDQIRKLIFHTKNPVARGISIFDVQEAWLRECKKKKVVGNIEKMMEVKYCCSV